MTIDPPDKKKISRDNAPRPWLKMWAWLGKGPKEKLFKLLWICGLLIKEINLSPKKLIAYLCDLPQSTHYKKQNKMEKEKLIAYLEECIAELEKNNHTHTDIGTTQTEQTDTLSLITGETDAVYDDVCKESKQLRNRAQLLSLIHI